MIRRELAGTEPGPGRVEFECLSEKMHWGKGTGQKVLLAESGRSWSYKSGQNRTDKHF